MDDTRQENTRTLRKLIVVAILMFGFGFALVPFYEKICQVTGLRSLFQPDTVENTQLDTSRVLNIEFDANVRSELPWRFGPDQRRQTAHPGQIIQVVYDVENTAGRDIVGQAIPSYSPARAGQYVSKLECFCFNQQRFKAGEKRRMPVVLVIDPKLPADIHTITLSYSFFEVAGTSTPAKQAPSSKAP